MKLLLSLLLASVLSAHGQSPTDWQKGFVKTLRAVAATDHSKTSSSGDLDGAQSLASAKLPDHIEAGNAVMRLWLSDQQDTVELIWWRQSDRPTRVLIAALYYCITLEPIGGIPPLIVYADRFREKEAAERKEELDYLNNHLSAIAAELAKATAGIPRAKVVHADYENVAKAKVGSPLPK